jgi:hypothetical protein
MQPAALYNLGHVRFRQGVEELQKGPSAHATSNQARAASQSADEALRAGGEALKDGELQNLVSSYLRGRGSRRELNAAIKAVRQAMEMHRTVLSRWQRASGDFRSAAEMNPKNENAKQNAEVLDRHIARLIDMIQLLQDMANALGEKKQDLKSMLQKLKGQIPEPDMPPGAAGDDDEEEPEQPRGGEPVQKEQAGKEGNEITLSPEQAGWLLESYKLDSDRRLPMGQQGTSDPKARNRPDW